MRSQAKASTAGSTQRYTKGLGVLCGVLAAALSVLVFASAAHAAIVIDLDGGGTGSVTSSPAGVECSNVGGGSPGPACSASFGFEGVQLTAAPGDGYFFSHWSGDDPFPGFFGPTCNEGSANPCTALDAAAVFGVGDTHITATFDCSSFLATTGDVSPGATDRLRTFEGTVDPEGCGVAESYFEYGPTTEYGSRTATVPGPSGLNGDSPIAVSAGTEPLEPNTTYHYRLVVANPGGTVAGEDRTFTTGPQPTGECNEARRHEQGIAAIVLPPCMALEMVSPPQKNSQPAGEARVSADGERVIFRSAGALGTPGALNPGGGDLFVAGRGESGWAASPTIPPTGMVRGWGQFGVGEAASFTPDFSRWLQASATLQQAQIGVMQVFQAGLGGHFSPLSPQLVPLSGGQKAHVQGSDFIAASADHSRVYFVPGRLSLGEAAAAYLLGDPAPSGSGADRNTYVAGLDASGQPSLELLARDREGRAWGARCGTRVGGDGPLSGGFGRRTQGAISADGSRTYFSTRPSQPEGEACGSFNKLRVLERLDTEHGVWIGPLFGSECARSSPPCPGTGTGTLLGPGTGAGNRTAGSSELTNVITISGAFAVGQTIAGPGIPAGTKITTVGSSTLTLSAAATSTGNNGALTAGSKRVTKVTASTGSFAVGMRVSGAGLPANATIAGVPSPTELELSANATASGSVALAGDDGNDLYEGASISGSKVYFTTNRVLADSDLDLGSPECNAGAGAAGCDLYLYDAAREAGNRLVQVSVGGAGDPTPGKGARVLAGVTAISPDGSRVYFVARDVLTTDPNPLGAQAASGQANLYTWHEPTESTAFLGTLASGDGLSRTALWGSEGTFRNQAYPVPVHDGGDGHILVFQSRASLSLEDIDGGFRDVYRYDAEGEALELISKAAPGGADGGPFNVTERGWRSQQFAPGTDVVEAERWVSEDGETIAFATVDALLPGDVNGARDGYLWREGELYRLPKAANAGEAVPGDAPVLSADGSEVAFLSFAQLLPRDGDTAKDVYVARVDGGFAEPPPPDLCDALVEGDCPGPVEEPPAAPNAASAALVGPGNVQPGRRSCRKGKVRRRGHCVKARKRNKRSGRKARNRHANANRRAGK